MRHTESSWTRSLAVSLLAAQTTWVTLLSWSGFAERSAAYLVPLLGVGLAVAVAGTGLRSLRAPALLVASVQVVMVLAWLHHRLSAGDALAGWVPTPSSLSAVSDALAGSSAAAQQFAAPVPASATPVFAPLLIVSGSATIVLVDLLAIGLRRVALAGLPLLAAYTAPVSILAQGVSWLTFAAAALCFLLLLAAVESTRLTRWGRNLSATVAPGEPESALSGPGGLWSSARTIGVTATALALVVPLLLPTFGGTFFSGGRGNGSGSGDVVSISNPMVDLRRDLTRGTDVDLLTVRTQDPDPSYLRISVLDSFDGTAWRPADRDIPVEQRANGPVSSPPGLDQDVARREYTSAITTSDFFRSRWLPTPYPAVSVNAPGDWRYDRTTLDFINASENQTAAGLSYTLRALEVRPTAGQLADAAIAPSDIAESGTALPDSFPASVRALAQRVTAGKDSRFEKGVALQQWFRVGGGFRYSLARSAGNGTDDLVRFLGTGEGSRVGYCEQFAAAMAIMGAHARHPLTGRRGLPEPTVPGRQPLRLLQPRPARLARDVLRRHRLGALRADSVGPGRRRAVVHHRTGAAGGRVRSPERGPIAALRREPGRPAPERARCRQHHHRLLVPRGARGTGGTGGPAPRPAGGRPAAAATPGDPAPSVDCLEGRGPGGGGLAGGP